MNNGFMGINRSWSSFPTESQQAGGFQGLSPVPKAPEIPGDGLGDVGSKQIRQGWYHQELLMEALCSWWVKVPCALKFPHSKHCWMKADFPRELCEGDVSSRTPKETSSSCEEAQAPRQGQHQCWLWSILCPSVWRCPMGWSGADVPTQLPLRMNKELFQPCLLLSLDPRYSLVGALDSQKTGVKTPELHPTFLCPWGCLVFQCGTEEKAEKTGFSALWRTPESIYTTLFFQLYLLFQYWTKGRKLPVRFNFLHCLFLPFHRFPKELVDIRDGWRLQRSSF